LFFSDLLLFGPCSLPCRSVALRLSKGQSQLPSASIEPLHFPVYNTPVYIENRHLNFLGSLGIGSVAPRHRCGDFCEIENGILFPKLTADR
jgi:hypothetical protein